MLADGRVLAIGGQTQSLQAGDINVGVLPTEIWDPVTETWSDDRPDCSPAQLPLRLPCSCPTGASWSPVAGTRRTTPGLVSSPRRSTHRRTSSTALGRRSPTCLPAPDTARTCRSRRPSTDVDPLGQPRLARRRHAPERHEPALRPVDLHRQRGRRHGADADQRRARTACELHGVHRQRSGRPLGRIDAQRHATGRQRRQHRSNVTAAAANQSATVSWTAATSGGSPITGDTVTPYIGATAQTPTTITGTPPATSTTITGLTNGTTYTFKVKATNVDRHGSRLRSLQLGRADDPAGRPDVRATSGEDTVVGDDRWVGSCHAIERDRWQPIDRPDGDVELHGGRPRQA